MSQRFALPPFDQTALLLDMDGTLIDIAPTPDAVVAPAEMLESLRRLRARLDDAVAVVSGRPADQLEALLGDAPFALASEHGGALRYRPGAALERVALPRPDPAWLAEAEQMVRRHPKLLLERKENGFVVHYRAAPELGQVAEAELARMLRDSALFTIEPARMAWEVRPRGADKGTAVAALMRLRPFVGRLPLFIGDDVTDEDGIAASVALGGAGLRVPEAFSGAPAQVRDWLARAAQSGAWPEL